MAKNLCNKIVTPEQAYEVYQAGSFIYYVLRKYKSDESSAKDPFSRWYCMTVSPACPKGEFGDAYVTTVKQGRRIANPLAVQDNSTTGEVHEAR